MGVSTNGAGMMALHMSVTLPLAKGIGAVRFATRRTRRAVQTYGWSGLPLALANLRGVATTREVPVPGRSRPLSARLGRRESDLATLLSVFSGDYEIDLADPSVIIDAGANAGYATVFFAERHPDAWVLAIEPDPSNVELLRRNTAHLSNVTVIAAALMGFDGEAGLIDPDQGPWAMRVMADGEGWSAGSHVETVRCVSVPSLLRSFHIERVSLLKMDIEGSELDVLTGCDEWIGHVDALVVELHDRFRPGCTAAFERATVEFPTRRAQGENEFVSRASR